MDFILQQKNSAPQLESTGKLNLSDWQKPTDLTTIMNRDIVKLPGGKQVRVSQSPNNPSDEILALDNDELTWVANQGAFPEVWCLLFLRGLTDEIRAIAPMLSVHSFYVAHKAEITSKVEENLNSDASSEWVEYYTTALREFPIFKTALFELPEKWRDIVALSYLDIYNDIKYLSVEQLQSLTTQQKIKILSTVLKESQNDPGKRDIALGLFGDDDTVTAIEAATLLGATTSSVVAGAFMACVPFYSDKTNAHNTVATWIRHCVNEQIGTNQSVWYKLANDIEFQHGFSLSGSYIKNIQGQAIGGVSHISGNIDPQMVKSRPAIGPGTWI